MSLNFDITFETQSSKSRKKIFKLLFFNYNRHYVLARFVIGLHGGSFIHVKTL